MLLKVLFGSQISKIKMGGLVLILLAYAPGVFRESFWSDDYPALMDTPTVVDHILKDARPTAAALFSISYSLLDGPENAWILRSLALIALLLIFLFISNRITNSRYGNIGIFSIAIAFCLPSFQMYIHWSITWPLLWIALAGLYSFHFWSSKLIIGRVIGVFLLVLALTAYPPVALFFFSAIAVINVLNESKIPKFLSDVVQGLILLIISGIVSILTVIVTMQFASISPNNRVAAILSLSEIPEKILWLLSRPIVVGLRPFLIDSPTPKIALLTALPVLAILLFGIKRQSQHLGESIFHRGFWIVVPLALTLIPLMITSDNQIEFRVLPGYSWGVAALASFFLLRSLESLLQSLIKNERVRGFSLLVAPSALALVAVFTVNSHYVDLFGAPYQKKNAFLNTSISSCVKGGLIKSVSILPPKLPFPSYQRLGVFSMSTDLASEWVPKPNVELLLQQRGINASVVYRATRPLVGEFAATECVIDLEEFRKLLL